MADMRIDDLIKEVDALVGREVRATIEMRLVALSSAETIEGVATWSGERPSCSPGFLRVGDSGIPIGSHGCRDVEQIRGGVRWADEIGAYELVATD